MTLVEPLEPIEDLEDKSFNPYAGYDDAMYRGMLDAYNVVAELRAKAPVVEGSFAELTNTPLVSGFVGRPNFVVMSYEGIDQVMNDPVTFSNMAFEPTLGRGFGHTVSVMDPPEHTVYRKILQRAFRPSVVTAWGNGIVGPVIDELVGKFRSTGKAELVEEFARPYPFNVIFRMLGLPADDIEIFYKLTIAQIHFDSSVCDDASVKLGRYFARMIERRRANPGDDVVSVVATAEVDGEYLPDDVAISFLRQLITAGGDTTFRTTVALFTGLLTNPDQLDAVRQDRALVPQAIEEALRWDGPVLQSFRLTTRDCEIDSVPVPGGAVLDVLYGAANHDPSVFERPEDFDIFRERHRHFGFAFGAHNCLGQQLARLEMTRALNAVLDELPNVRLDPDRPTPEKFGKPGHAPREIPVVFDV